MASKAPSSRPKATNTAGVSRKLFHHHLTRRPTSASTSTSSTTVLEATKDDTNEIVAKDSDGFFRIRVPKLPPLDDEQAQEEEMGNERDKLDAKMLELYKDRSLQPGDPTELIAVVQANLKRKVAALDEDNWIFEAEQPIKDS